MEDYIHGLAKLSCFRGEILKLQVVCDGGQNP